MTENGFGESYEVKTGGSWFKFDKVGARFVGIYRGHDERKDKLDKTGKFPYKTVHEFEMIAQFDTDKNEFKQGDTVLFDKTGEPGKIMNKALDNIPFGRVVGLCFAEQIKSKEAGFYPTHVIKVYDLSTDPKYLQYVDKKSESDAIVEDAVKNMPF